MADIRTMTNLRGPAARIAAATAEPIPAGAGTDVIMTGPDQNRQFHFLVERGLPGVNAVENDTAVATYVAATDSDTRGVLDKTFVRPRIRPLNGTRTLIVGDSLHILGTDGIKGQSHTTWGFWESGGRLNEQARIAVSGNTSAQQLTALNAYWAGAPNPKPTLALVLVGTNDIGQGQTMASWLANVQAIVAANMAQGCDTVLCTLPPRSGPTNPTSPAILNGQWNKALREYASANGITLVDYWGAVADPTTGEWRAGEVNPADGVHPNYKGTRRMANELKRALYPLLTEPVERGQAAGITTRVTGEAGGILPKPIFTAPGDPLTMGFTTATPAGAWTSVWEPAAPGGYAIELDVTNPSVQPDLMQRAFKSDGGWVNGDKLLATTRFRIISSKDIVPDVAGSGVRVSLVQIGGGPSYGVFCFGQFMPTADWQTVRFPFTPDPAATALYWYFQYLRPDGSITTDAIRARVASMQIYNLTALGIA